MSNKVFIAITLVELALLGGAVWWWLAGRGETSAGADDLPQTWSARIEPSGQPVAVPAASEAGEPVAAEPVEPARSQPSQPAAQPTARLPRGPLGELARPAILIDKSSRLLAVYDGGRLVKVYPAAVGARPGDKLREGDRRTPEGEFFVCVKNPVSKYTLALGLSYPAEEDAARGLREGLISQAEHRRIEAELRAGRRPPWDTALGGEIMIHGDRRGGRDTLGCIALEDDDIRELYPQIPIGTRVVIRP
jgi:lipoprotein-anchoring transpeptidase ErfK/SrfK